MTNIERYTNLCIQHVVHVFNHPWWLDAICGEGNWDVILVEDNDRIIGAMPIYLHEKKITMPLLTQKMGPIIIYPSNIDECKRQSFEKKVMGQIIKELPRFSTFYMHFDNSITNWLPFYWEGFSQTTRYTYIIEDISDPLSVFKSFEDSKRRQIKKALKNIKTKVGMDVESFYNYHRASLEKQNRKINYSLEVMKSIYRNSKTNNSGEIFYCESDSGEIHCAVFVVWDKTTVYLLITAFDPDYRDSGASSLIIFDLIKYFSGRVKSFDFEGSMGESVSESYRRYGTVQKQYFQITKDNRSLLRKHVDKISDFLKDRINKRLKLW